MIEEIKLKLKKLTEPKYILIFLLLIFTIHSFYYVFKINRYSPPDENYHVRVINLQSQSLNPFLENPEDSNLGELSRQPFLYHYTASLLKPLNIFSLPDFLYYRLFSPILGIISLIFVYKTTQLLSKSKYTGVLAVALMILSQMYTLSYSSVSYDVFVNLFAIINIFFFVRYLKNPNINDLILGLNFSFLGSLTKSTFVPFTGLYVIFVALRTLLLIYSNRKSIFKLQSYKPIFKSLNRINLIAFTVISFFIFLLFGVNFINYKTPLPSCDKVASYEYCRQNGPFDRDEKFREAFEEEPKELMSFFDYSEEWAKKILQGAIGIFVHDYFYENRPAYYLIIGLSVISLILIPFRIIQKKLSPHILTLILFASLYTLVLFMFNYTNYLQTGVFGVATQGRYIFPVFSIIPIMISTILLSYSKINRRIILIPAILLIVAFSFFNLYKLHRQLPAFVRMNPDYLFEANS